MSMPPFDSTAYSTYSILDVQSENRHHSYRKRLGRRQICRVGSLYYAETDKVDIYEVLITGIVLRPIAFVSTISEEGIENLTPFK